MDHEVGWKKIKKKYMNHPQLTHCWRIILEKKIKKNIEKKILGST